MWGALRIFCETLFPLAYVDCRVDGVWRRPYAVGAIHCDNAPGARGHVS